MMLDGARYNLSSVWKEQQTRPLTMRMEQIEADAGQLELRTLYGLNRKERRRITHRLSMNREEKHESFQFTIRT